MGPKKFGSRYHVALHRKPFVPSGMVVVDVTASCSIGHRHGQSATVIDDGWWPKMAENDGRAYVSSLVFNCDKEQHD